MLDGAFYAIFSPSLTMQVLGTDADHDEPGRRRRPTWSCTRNRSGGAGSYFTPQPPGIETKATPLEEPRRVDAEEKTPTSTAEANVPLEPSLLR
jgi:hypothetical protein